MQIPFRDGDIIKGLMSIPAGAPPFPTVIFVSGLGMTMHEWNNSFDEIAKHLVDAGMLTVQFQFPIFDAGGRCRELPLGKRAIIVEDVIERVKKRSGVDQKKIGILAQSYGVPTVMSANFSGVASLLFVSGTYLVNKSIICVYEERGVNINFEGDTSLPRSGGENTTVGKEFWQDAAAFDAAERARNIRLPTFLIHGDKDSKITTEDVQMVFAAIANKEKKLKIFKDGDHGITDVPRPMREEFLQDILNWFKGSFGL